MKAMTKDASKLGALCLVLSILFYASSAAAVGYEMMPSGMLQLDDGRIVGNDGYHMMPDGSLMLNDGTMLDNAPQSGQGQAKSSHDSMTGNMGGMAMSAETPAAGPHVHHHHGAGSMMAEYSFMRMQMKNLKDGSYSVTGEEAVSASGDYNYMMSPVTMTMDMHMLMMMIGINNELTFMSMFNYRSNQMLMVAQGETYTQMSTEGMGDTDVALMYNINDMFIANLGLSVPTGSINERISMTMNAASGSGTTTVTGNAPYTMQLGSGSYSLKPSVTYSQSMDMFNWGAQGAYTYRMANNDNNYRLGNRLDVDGWFKWMFNPQSDISLRLNFAQWGKITGQDPKIAITMPMQMAGGGTMIMKTSPLANPANYGGMRLNTTLAYSGKSRGGLGYSFALGMPVYQKLNGVQMDTSLIISTSISTMF